MAKDSAKKPEKRSYTVRDGQTIRVGVRITEKEQNDLGLPTAKKSITYVGGQQVELTDAEAMSMRHALEDAPELTDAEVEQHIARAKELGDDNPDRDAIEEVVRSRQVAHTPDFGRIPRAHEVDLMMKANRRHEREQKNNPDRKAGDGFRQIDPGATAAGGGANRGRGADTDA